MNDNKGTSLVITNSDAGKILFEHLKEKMSFSRVSLENAVKYNSSAIKSSVCPQKIRMSFFEDLDKLSFEKLLIKYCAAKPKEKIRKAVGRLLKKFKIYGRL